MGLLEDQAEAKLSEREMLIAREAARMAVKDITDGFYRDVGKTLVSKVLIWLGVAAVAFAAGRGWLKLP